MFSKKDGKRREYVNAKRLLQRARQKLTQEERARRQRMAQDMELQAMAANGLLPADFAFTVDVRPLDEDDDLPLTAAPVLLVPLERCATHGRGRMRKCRMMKMTEMRIAIRCGKIWKSLD